MVYIIMYNISVLYPFSKEEVAMNAPFRFTPSASPINKLRRRLEEIRPLFEDGRGYFPRTTPNGSASNAWLQTRGFKNVTTFGNGFIADLPEGWSANPPLYVVGQSLEVEVRDANRRVALTVRMGIDRNGRMSEAMVPRGEYWYANQRPRQYPIYSRPEPSLWPVILLNVIIVAGILSFGTMAIRNRVTFDRAESRIAEVLSVDEVDLVDHSANQFLIGEPYEVTFNVRTADGEIISVHCQDGIWKSLFCTTRDS